MDQGLRLLHLHGRSERQRGGDLAREYAREPGLVPGAGVRRGFRDQRELRAVHPAGAAGWVTAGMVGDGAQSMDFWITARMDASLAGSSKPNPGH